MPEPGSAISLTIRAPAKINLVLLVDPPLPVGHPKAGFHEIASWFCCLDLCDDVLLTRVASGQLAHPSVRWAPDAPVPSPIDWPIDKDLAVRAHRALEAAVGRVLPARVDVIKRIPVGGGLGGGSSDAAAALLGLDRLFNLGMGTTRLREIGVTLGSDVGFFVDQHSPARPALVGGLGRVEERLPVVQSDVLLAIPDFGCPTGAVYRAFDAAPTPKGRASVENVRAAALAAAESGTIETTALENDLARAAIAVQPRLGAVLSDLARVVGGRWHVTGSGSCCFSLGESGGPAPVLPGVRFVRTRLV